MHNNTVLINVKGLEKSFNTQKIFADIQFEIKNGERIGLVGLNGTGKTTLANLIFGKLQPDQGVIEKRNDLAIGYLSQSIDYEINDFHKSFAKNMEDEFFQHVSELGLKKVSDWDEHKLAHLSCGEKLKLALSQVWASKPEFLILDEPTNHLDFKGIRWLISELEKFHGPVLIISHDRHFLDQTVERIFEIESGKLHFYNGNYSAYREEKQRRAEAHRHQYHVQQRHIKEIETQMEQLRSWSDKAHRESTKKEGVKEYYRMKAKKRDNQIKSKMKRLENELVKNKVEQPREDASVRFQFDSRGKRGKRIIEAKNLGMAFNGRKLISGSQFYINQGERIGLLGENGCGKTTLIKVILGLVSGTEGELWKSDSLKIAYLCQDVGDLPIEKTAIEALGFTDRDQLLQVRTLFANLGLKEQHISRPIGCLSLGERTRVKLVDMLMKEYDVLVLDEPTNHLDLPSREELEKTLSEFTGTIIAVSHDYYFLNKLCDGLLVFENQQIKRLEMKAEEYFNEDEQEKGKPDETLMVLDNQIAAILGELSLLDQKNPKYALLDQEFNELLKKKKNLFG